jgi:hypothetical protein
MADENTNNEQPQMTPEEVYNFFKEMSVEQLEKLAKDAIFALDEADSRAEAEKAVIKMAPFFLDCTFHRLPESIKAKLRKCLDDAEDKHGSLASVLGLDEALAEQEKAEKEEEGKKNGGQA